MYRKAIKALALALAILAAISAPTPAMAKQAPQNLPQIEYSAQYEFCMAAEERIFERVNEMRQNPSKFTIQDGNKPVSGIHPKTHALTRSTVIKRIARYKSLHMAAYGDFNHQYTKGQLAGVGASGTSELVFFETMYWAENIAYRSTTASYSGAEFGELLFNQWLNSPGHLSAMMSPRVYYIGIGVAAIRKNSSIYVYGTQQFSSDNPSGSKEVPNPITTGGSEGSIVGSGSYSSNSSTNWVKTGNSWYLLRNGAVQTGWQKLNDKWYFLDRKSGAMQTGWVKDGGNWYYMNGSGAMQTGWQRLNGNWYYLKPSGIMATGWQSLNGKWYYLYGNGVMATGWLKLGNNWYYLDSSGVMATGNRVINGSTHGFSASGVWLGQR